MKINVKELSLRIVKLTDLALVTLLFALTWIYHYTNVLENPFLWKGNVVMIGLFAFLFFFFVHTYDGFYISYNTISETVSEQILGLFFTDAVMFVIIFILARARMQTLLPFIAMFVAQLIIVTLWSYLSHIWYFKKFPAKNCAVIYDERKGMENLINQYGFEKKFNVVSTMHVKECLEDITCLDNVKTVFLSGIVSHDRNIILKYCVKNNITIFMVPRIGDIIMSGAHEVHMFHLPIMKVGRYHLSNEFRFIKRAFDLISATLLLILVSPLMLITAIAIKAYDKGPVYYKQTRLTQDGKEFKVIKFRSMRVDAEKDGIARLSTGENDDRITPIGKKIRACRIDELPQLINIIKGDMSVVGPRPERPEIAKQYAEKMPEFDLRLQVKAGLTGYAQIYGKYNTTPYDKLQMDLMYIAHMNPIEDLRIIFATILVLFKKESTEGVEQGKIIAN